MPPPEFFARLGLFVHGEFLDAATCTRMRAELSRAPGMPATVYADEHSTDTDVDVAYRRVHQREAAPWAVTLMEERLTALLPTLARHFDVGLAACEAPAFLVYGPGDFYVMHVDGDATVPRKVSVVVFLNGENDSDEQYEGGALTFHGLAADPVMGRFGLPLQSRTGLLVAFASGVRHEVRPVVSGQRYSIVSWAR